MGKNEKLKVYWRGNEIGEIHDPISDMWYLEGEWVNNGTKESEEFEALVKSFTPREILKEPSKGTRILLAGAEGDKSTHALIMGLADKSLLLRRIFEKETIEWLIANVK
jgi:hypothetical protein